MIALQVLNKILSTQDGKILTEYALTSNHFAGYEQEYNFIKEHLDNFKKVPDKATFLNNFPDFELIDVKEDNEYLANSLKEEELYYRSAEVIQTAAEKLKSNANDAVNYLQNKLIELQPSEVIKGVDILKQSRLRFEEYKNKQNCTVPFYIKTGFKELDDIIGGWAKGEEFVVFFARTGMGKSWMLIKSMATAVEQGYNVGYISPEMSASKIGYRFDTVVSNFSNRDLVRGNAVNGYENYIDTLSEFPSKFLVTTPKDFQRNITVSKLRAYCMNNDLDILAIDGITYLRDERRQRGDNKTTMLTNISEDLMSLSCDLKIPILTVVQSNREGVKQDSEGTPELENIRDSDGIAFNATKVISLKQNSGCLEMCVKKHRDGEFGGTLNYTWNIDKGEFRYMPINNTSNTTSCAPSVNMKRPTNDIDVF